MYRERLGSRHKRTSRCNGKQTQRQAETRGKADAIQADAIQAGAKASRCESKHTVCKGEQV
jgi:hypothetical protein